MIEDIIRKYPPLDRTNLISMLQDVQDLHGYLPETALVEISEHIGSSLASVYAVATFYNQFRLKPLGKNLIRVCRGTACHVKNSANILSFLESELGIKAGQTTRDKLFTLETVACMGACSIAPVININNEYYGRLRLKDIPRILEDCRRIDKKESQKENVEAG